MATASIDRLRGARSNHSISKNCQKKTSSKKKRVLRNGVKIVEEKDFFENDTVKLVETVEKLPSLWNTSVPEYSCKKAKALAWKTLSKEMKESKSICKNRWKNIRQTFTRSLREDSIAKARGPYYLAKNLEFVIPYLKYQPLRAEDNENSLIENIDSVESSTVNNEQSSITRSTSIDETQPMEESEQESHKSNKSSEKDATPLRIRILSGKQNKNTHDDEDDDDSGVFVQCRVRKKTKSEEVNANQSYLNSLLPYLREMTGKQNRRFRQKVIALIDEILDDADIPQVILHPISARDSSVLHPSGFSSERHFRSVNEDRQIM